MGERSHRCRPQIKPGSRGPIQQGRASMASLPPVGPAQCPILDYSRPYPGERRERAAVPARRPAARPRCTRRSRTIDGDEAATGGAIGGADDELEGQALVVREAWPLSSCCWSSPGPLAGSEPPARRRRLRHNSAAVNSPGEWARRSPRYGPPGASAGTAGSGGRARCRRMGGTE